MVECLLKIRPKFVWKRFKGGLNQIGIYGGTILLYEIQHQHFLDQFRGISLDVIAGPEMMLYLEGCEPLGEIAVRDKIDYIVCHKSALTKPELKKQKFKNYIKMGLNCN